MDAVIHQYNAEELNINPYEVLRYLGYVREHITEKDIEMVEELVPMAINAMDPRACESRFCVSTDGDTIMMPYGEIVSHDLGINLSGCDGIYIFAATIGTSFDRLVRTEMLRQKSRGVVINAIGAAAVEDVCDRVNDELRREAEKCGKHLRPRFSPGYGDLTLENQRGIFRMLNPEKNIGLTLKDSLFMAPEKSVTAIIGIY